MVKCAYVCLFLSATLLACSAGANASDAVAATEQDLGSGWRTSLPVGHFDRSVTLSLYSETYQQAAMGSGTTYGRYPVMVRVYGDAASDVWIDWTVVQATAVGLPQVAGTTTCKVADNGNDTSLGVCAATLPGTVTGGGGGLIEVSIDSWASPYGPLCVDWFSLADNAPHTKLWRSISSHTRLCADLPEAR
jgi:hypothetical protein